MNSVFVNPGIYSCAVDAFLEIFDSLCSSCLNFVAAALNSSIHLTVVTAYGLNQLGLDNNIWPLFVTEMHTNPGRLNCANYCEIPKLLWLF